MNIKNIKVINASVINNNKGDILKFVNKNDKFFKGFGEIYFSEIKKK